MASENEGGSAGEPGNGHGGQAPPRGGPPRGHVLMAIDGEDLLSMLAGHDQLREMVKKYLAISMREHELLRWINSRLEGQVVVLQQQIAILIAELSLRHGESPTAPDGDDKPQ